MENEDNMNHSHVSTPRIQSPHTPDAHHQHHASRSDVARTTPTTDAHLDASFLTTPTMGSPVSLASQFKETPKVDKPSQEGSSGRVARPSPIPTKIAARRKKQWLNQTYSGSQSQERTDDSQTEPNIQVEIEGLGHDTADDASYDYDVEDAKQYEENMQEATYTKHTDGYDLSDTDASNLHHEININNTTAGQTTTTTTTEDDTPSTKTGHNAALDTTPSSPTKKHSTTVHIMPPSSPIPSLDPTLPFYARNASPSDVSTNLASTLDSLDATTPSPLQLLSKKRPRAGIMAGSPPRSPPPLSSASTSASTSITSPAASSLQLDSQVHTQASDLPLADSPQPSQTPSLQHRTTPSPLRTMASLPHISKRVCTTGPSLITDGAGSGSGSSSNAGASAVANATTTTSPLRNHHHAPHSPPHTHAQPHPHSHSPTRLAPSSNLAAVPVTSSPSSNSSPIPSPVSSTASPILSQTLGSPENNVTESPKKSGFGPVLSASQGSSPPGARNILANMPRSSLRSLPSPTRTSSRVTEGGESQPPTDVSSSSSFAQEPPSPSKATLGSGPRMSYAVSTLASLPSPAPGTTNVIRTAVSTPSAVSATEAAPAAAAKQDALVSTSQHPSGVEPKPKVLTSILRRAYPLSHPSARLKRVQQRSAYAWMPHPVQPRTTPRPIDHPEQNRSLSNESSSTDEEDEDEDVDEDQTETEEYGMGDADESSETVAKMTHAKRRTGRKIRFSVCHVAEFPLFPDWSKTPCEDDEHFSIGFAPDPTRSYTVTVNERSRRQAFDSAGAVRSIPEGARAAAWQAIHNQLIALANELASAQPTPSTSPQHPTVSTMPGAGLNLGGFTRAVGLGGMGARASYAAAAAAAAVVAAATTSGSTNPIAPTSTTGMTVNSSTPRPKIGSPRLRMVLLEILRDLMEQAGFAQPATWLGRVCIPKYQVLLQERQNTHKSNQTQAASGTGPSSSAPGSPCIPLPPLPAPTSDSIRRALIQFSKQLPRLEFSDREELDALRRRRFEVGCRCQPRVVSGGCRGVACGCASLGLMCSGDACECTRPSCSNPWGRHGFNQRRVDAVRRLILRRCRIVEAAGGYGCPKLVADDIRARQDRFHAHTATEPNLPELKRQLGIAIPIIDSSDDESPVDVENQPPVKKRSVQWKKRVRYQKRKRQLRGGYTLAVSSGDDARLNAVLLAASEQLERQGEGIYTLYDFGLSDLESDVEDQHDEESDQDQESSMSRPRGRSYSAQLLNDEYDSENVEGDESEEVQLARLASLSDEEESNDFEDYLDETVNDLVDDAGNVPNGNLSLRMPTLPSSVTSLRGHSPMHHSSGQSFGLMEHFNAASGLEDAEMEDDGAGVEFEGDDILDEEEDIYDDAEDEGRGYGDFFALLNGNGVNTASGSSHAANSGQFSLQDHSFLGMDQHPVLYTETYAPGADSEHDESGEELHEEDSAASGFVIPGEETGETVQNGFDTERKS